MMIRPDRRAARYYDEGGEPMLGSATVRHPKFQDRVVAETRALLAAGRLGLASVAPR